MFVLIAIGVFLFLLHQRGSLGPFRWEGRQFSPAGQHGPSMHRGPWGYPAQLGPASDSAESILARRLADGEIDSDEYLERSALLKG